MQCLHFLKILPGFARFCTGGFPTTTYERGPTSATPTYDRHDLRAWPDQALSRLGAAATSGVARPGNCRDLRHATGPGGDRDLWPDLIIAATSRARCDLIIPRLVLAPAKREFIPTGYIRQRKSTPCWAKTAQHASKAPPLPTSGAGHHRRNDLVSKQLGGDLALSKNNNSAVRGE